MTEVVRVTGVRFSASVDEAAEMIRVQLVGAADEAAVALIAQVVNAAHQHAQTLGTTQVKVDIRELSFMTSASFKEIITWLEKVRSTGAGYHITFLSSSSFPWQRRTLHALSRFARELITIQVA
jgi:hypothetical protein